MNGLNNKNNNSGNISLLSDFYMRPSMPELIREDFVPSSTIKNDKLIKNKDIKIGTSSIPKFLETFFGWLNKTGFDDEHTKGILAKDLIRRVIVQGITENNQKEFEQTLQHLQQERKVSVPKLPEFLKHGAKLEKWLELEKWLKIIGFDDERIGGIFAKDLVWDIVKRGYAGNDRQDFMKILQSQASLQAIKTKKVPSLVQVMAKTPFLPEYLNKVGDHPGSLTEPLKDWLKETGFDSNHIKNILENSIIKQILEKGNANGNEQAFIDVIQKEAIEQNKEKGDRLTLKIYGISPTLPEFLQDPFSFHNNTSFNKSNNITLDEAKTLLKKWLVDNGFDEERIQLILADNITQQFLTGQVTTDMEKIQYLQFLTTQAEYQLGIRTK